MMGTNWSLAAALTALVISPAVVCRAGTAASWAARLERLRTAAGLMPTVTTRVGGAQGAEIGLGRLLLRRDLLGVAAAGERQGGDDQRGHRCRPPGSLPAW